MNPNCVAGLVLFTPSSPGQTIYRPGKPGEIVEIITDDKKEFVPENPGLFPEKIPMHRTDFQGFFGEHRPNSEKRSL